MAYPIKMLRDENKEPFIPFVNSNSIVVDGGILLQDSLDVKLDPADVKAGANIKVTPGTDTTTVAWVRPTNLNVQDNLTTTAAGQGVLDARQGKILLDNINTRILASEKGVANGVATLDGEGHVPSAQLPSYVDDIIEAYIRNGATGLSKEWLSLTEGGAALEPEKGKIYVIMSAGDWQNKQYRWGGSTYALCNPSDVNSVNGMTGIITLKKLTIQKNGTQVGDTYNGSTDEVINIGVPTKVSELTNDKNYIDATASITGNAATATTADKTKGTLTIKMKNYDTDTETTDTFNGNADKTITIGVPTKVSQLTNDSAYITSSASITGNAATATTASKTTGTLTIQKNGTTVKTFNGSSNQTANITVPTKVSELTNDKGYLTFVPVATDTVSGTVKVGTGLAINSNGVLYVTGEGVTAEQVEWDNINGKPTNVSYFTNDAGYITADDFIEGNAATATKLETARTINGTSFDGSANITTANWGTARNISISDSDGTNTGTAVSVNGSGAVTLKLPATIKASLSGNATTATTATTANKTAGTLTIQKNGTNITTFNGSNATANITFKTSEITNDSGYITSSASITGNAATATTLATARTLTIGSTGKTFNGSANVSWTLAEIGAAAASHTHNYAGSSSAGGAANSVKTNLIIKLNGGSTEGTDLFTFNGSTAKTVNITASGIGAAASSHTHSYAGSSSAGGAANSVKTNLIIKLNGGSTEGTNLFTFNGSTAKTVNITASGIGAAASSHTHSYLPLSGGTLTGLVTSSYTSTTWINSANGKSAINLSGTGYTGWIAGNAKNGRLVISSYPGSDDKLYFGYMTNDAITAGTNALTRQMSWDGSTGTLTATTFAGKMSNTLTLTKNGSNSTYNGSAATTVTIPTIHTGTGVPAASLGQNGDIYIVTG